MNVAPGTSRLIDEILEATVVASFTKIGYAVRSQTDDWVDPPDAEGRTMVITGATSGLGLAMAQRLATLGAHIHLVGRSEQKIVAATSLVSQSARGTVSGHRCDLSMLADTTQLAAQLATSCGPIDVLIHNAGALLSTYTLTSEGVETTLATQVLSPYLLTEHLITSGSFAPAARIIMMTSGGMYTERFDLAGLEMDASHYKGSVAYARAKRAQTVLVGHWQNVYGPTGLAFHLVHPGWAATPGVSNGIPGFSKVMGPLLRSPHQGADTTVWLAGLPDGQPRPGQLWLDRRPRELYRLRKTRLNPVEEVAAEVALPLWCDARIDRAVADS